MKRRSLRSFLVILLLATTTSVFLLLGTVLLLYRLPDIAASSQANASRQASELAHLVEFYLRSIESRLKPATALDKTSAQRQLDALTEGDQAIQAIYSLSPEGAIQSVGLPPEARFRRKELLIGDFSSNRLFQNARANQRITWSDKYLSAMSGRVVIGVAIPNERQVIIGEIAPSAIFDAISTLSQRYGTPVLAVDSRGEWLADNAPGDSQQLQNWAGHPDILLALSEKTAESGSSLIFGSPHYTGHARSEKMGWNFLVGIPAGIDNPDIRASLALVGAGFIAALLVSLLLAPGWSTQLARPLRKLIERTHQLAAGNFTTPLPPSSSIREIADLEGDLESMAAALREREERLQSSRAELQDQERELRAIFNASPAAMTVSDTRNQYRIVALNDAWETQFGRSREQAIGKNGAEIGLWEKEADRIEFVRRLEAEGRIDDHEVWMLNQNGQRLLCRLSGRTVESVNGQRLLIMVQEDITSLRQTEQALQELNAELETRVANRTEALEKSNRELASTLNHLRLAQSELVRTEKQAALGRLVAGVAHEMNTPIGNALIAATTSRDHLRGLQRASEAGNLRRSDFANYIQNAEMAGDIVIRNLERSATLVNSFKRVAVDQSNDQRRPFLLDETIAETLLILHPSLKRTPFRIENEIPEGIHCDSYPGALEQVLANLIQNAVLHAFEGRSEGHIRIVAERPDAEHVRLSVCDDGIGIPPDMQQRIFDPFFTTKLGRGGSGLGLHICHNAVTGLLGGNIHVTSTPGKGSCFILDLPLIAPQMEVNFLPESASSTDGKTV